MKKSVYIVLWVVSIVLLAAILCSSAFMFSNGGGAGWDLENFDDEDETTKRHVSTKAPSIVTDKPVDVTEAPSNTTEVIIQPSPPEYTDSEKLGFNLNKDGTAYTVVGIGSCTDSIVVIPSEFKGLPVTEIAYRAFAENKDIEGVVIPGSVKTIGTAAFQACSSLKLLVLREGVWSIGSSAFADCSALENFEFPATALDIGAGAFKNCVSLTAVNLPEGLKKLNNGVFAGCRGIMAVSFPSTLTYICKRAFADCSGLSSINFNGTVTYNGGPETWWDGIVFETDWDIGSGNYTVYCIDGSFNKIKG